MLTDTLEFADRRLDAAAAAGFALSAGVLANREALDALADRWLSLEIASSDTGLFQSLGWARAIYDFEASRGNKDFDPVIVTLEQGRRLVGILPLERIRTLSRTVLVPLGNAFGQYAGALLAPGVDARAAIDTMLAKAIGSGPCDFVSLLKVRDGSALDRGLPPTKATTGAEQGAPFVALDGFADFASYFQTIRTKTRKNMRNARNRLEREGHVEHRLVTDPAERLALVDRTLSGRAERLRDQGLTSRAFRDSGFPQFCRSLVGRNDVTLAAFSLTHEGKPIAEQWGFVHAGRYYAFIASRDFSNSEESPGKLHLGEILEACSEMGIVGCDLGVPAMPYKLTFATQTVTVRDYALPVTPKGWMIIHLWDMRLRPALKALAMRMPSDWRSRVMKLFGHGH
ncbi:GNAT family N-acetyltransferase [Devosia chinhatensis]|nr:GNAT family N-acetyltransferase [Devosia chinhatensis]